jgi:hypothetical protein
MHRSISDRLPKTTQSEDRQPQAGGQDEVESLTTAAQLRIHHADMTPPVPPLSRPHLVPMSELHLRHRLAHLGFVAFFLVFCLVSWLAVTGRPLEAGATAVLGASVKPLFAFFAQLVAQSGPQKPEE